MADKWQLMKLIYQPPKYTLQTTGLGSGKVAGKVLMVDHM